MSKMEILCACSDNYAPYCGTMLTSLFCNNRHHCLSVYILSNGLSDDSRHRFDQLATQYGQKITIIPIDASSFEALPTGGRFSNISVEAYFRLNVCSLLPQHDRIIYLDCDMIVRSDLQPLWDTPLDDYAMAAVIDSTLSYPKCFPRLGYDPIQGYFNSGMGVYNLHFMRQHNFEGMVHDFVTQHSDLIVFHDQDIINCVCHGQIKAVSPTWNLLEVFLRKQPPVIKSWEAELLECRTHPAIIHYASLRKPWFKECVHPYRSEFWKYVALSPWKDLKPVYKYSGIERWTKHYLKRFLKSLVAPFGIGRYDRGLKLTD